MGFFSWNCNACGHPLLSHYVIEDRNEWMNHGVAILEDGSILKGEYDGYGRLNDHEIADYGEPEVYHEACWHLEGEPTEYDQPSESASDQGYFFDDNVHNFPEPKNQEDLRTLTVAGELAQQANKDAWKIAHLESLVGDARDVIAGITEKTEEVKKVFEDLDRHVRNEENRRNKKEAARLGLSLEDFLVLKEKRGALEKDDWKKDNPTMSFVKAEKLENGHFRLATQNDLVFDQDFENDKVYMVYDPYEEIAPGTERDEWIYHKESV
jgi:hypothetical protein